MSVSPPHVRIFQRLELGIELDPKHERGVEGGQRRLRGKATSAVGFAAVFDSADDDKISAEYIGF